MDLAGATREQLLAAVAHLDGEVASLRQLLTERDGQLTERDARLSEQHIGLVGLGEQVAELHARLGRDSSNSSKPPSSDSAYSKRKVKRGMRGSSGRKPGRQPGAPGMTLRQVDDPDEKVVCELEDCSDSGRSLADTPIEGVTRRPVFDPLPPPPRPRVTEYQLGKRRCPCGAQVAGPAPAGVLAPVSYGPGDATLALHVGAGQYLPVKRAAGVLATLAGMQVSTGCLATQRARAAKLV